MAEVPPIYLIKAIFTPMMKFFSLEACVWNFTYSHKNKLNKLKKRFLNQIWCGLSVCRRVQNRTVGSVAAAVVVVYDCNLKSIDCIEHIRTQSQLIHFISFCLAVFHFFLFFLLFSHGKRFRTFEICTKRRKE